MRRKGGKKKKWKTQSMVDRRPKWEEGWGFVGEKNFSKEDTPPTLNPVTKKNQQKEKHRGGGGKEKKN